MAKIVQEIESYMKSGYVLLQIVTWEEERALEMVAEAAKRLQRPVSQWSAGSGFGDNNKTASADPMEGLVRMSVTKGPRVFALLDFHACLERPEVVRRLRELCSLMEAKEQCAVMIGPTAALPMELEKDAVVLDLDPPSPAELLDILDECVTRAGHSGELKSAKDLREVVVRAARGLTAREARRMLTRILLTHPEFGRDHVREVLEAKRQALRRSDMLEFYDAQETLDDMGGLDLLKQWLMNRAQAFGGRAREYGLPEPKGLLLLGVQGCGKSLSAKAVSGLWGIPLIRLDLSAVLEAESRGDQLRRSLRMAEGLAPCVLWIDEIEKGFNAHQVSGMAEEGRMARAFATFLTWLQEKRSPVYVIASANSISELPPELVRKGRFDDIFFVDLPRDNERREIFRIHLIKRNRDPEDFDLTLLAGAAEGFSGSEIEQAVISAMYDAFTAGREIETKDIAKALQETVPLLETMEEQIKQLRDWAKTRARPASLDTKLMDLLHGAKEE